MSPNGPFYATIFAITPSIGLLFREDYYPFGMEMPGRSADAGDYRYGFQGQEHDDEVKGEGNSINFKYRMHDPRIGRFFAVDPLASKYPTLSPYQFAGNSVIKFIELEGLEPKDPGSEAGEQQQAANEFGDIFNYTWTETKKGEHHWVVGDKYEGPTPAEAASISAHVYSLDKPGYKSEVPGAQGWELIDRKVEGQFKAGVYRRIIDGVSFYTIAYGGTDPSSVADWSEDILQAVGWPTGSYQLGVNYAEEWSNKVNNMGGKNYLTTTGHSLGGGIASAAALSIGVSATTFNAAGISDGARQLLGLTGKTTQIDAYIIKGEAVDMAQRSILGIHAEGTIHYLNPATEILSMRDFMYQQDDIFDGERGINGYAMIMTPQRYLNYRMGKSIDLHLINEFISIFNH